MKNAIVLTALALSCTAPALAAPLKEVPARLDPTKAYILVEIANFNDTNAAGTLVLARYDRDGGDVRGGTRSKAPPLAKGVAVRESIVSKPLVKAKNSRLYLLEVEPDAWVIEGSAGTAYSLGSYSFDAPAGKIVDLGVLAPRTDWREGDSQGKANRQLLTSALLGGFGKKMEPTPTMIAARSRQSSDLAVPAALAKIGVQPVSFVAGAKFGNYLGGLVNRIDGRQARPGASANDTAGKAAD